MLIKILGSLACVCLLLNSVEAQTYHRKPRKSNFEGRRLIVVDNRLAALRERPDVKAALVSRLSRGRLIGYLGLSKNGYLAVSVSRNMRGWILAASVVRPGSREGADLIFELIDEATDEFQKARLAQLVLLEFPLMRARALLALGTAAEAAAEKLSKEAIRRLGDTDRELLLNYSGLDRYNKIGITFDFREGKLVYDGVAYRELVRKYPNSIEGVEARRRLGR